jgi:plasmid stabilization system protein ParE
VQYEVSISSQAERDLYELFAAVFETAGDLQTAENWLARLEERIFSLEQFPRRYRLYDRGAWKNRGLRMMPVGKVNVFYTTDDDLKIVSIVRVFSAAADVLQE